MFPNPRSSGRATRSQTTGRPIRRRRLARLEELILRQVRLASSDRFLRFERFGRIDAPLAAVLASTCLLWSCSDRDSVKPDPNPAAESGTFELAVELEISQLGEIESAAALGTDGFAVADRAPAGPGTAGSGAANRVPGSGTLTLTAEILSAADDEIVDTVSQTIEETATSALLSLDLPANADYVAQVRVEGARSRPTGITETGLLHVGSTEPFPIETDATTSRALTLPDLVPQLWLHEVPGERHELFWSPVEAATSYTVRRSPDGSIPTTFSTASLDTTFTLPPGFQGGTSIGYTVQAVLTDGSRSAYSEGRTANDPGPVPPADITDLAAFSVTSTQVVLRWTAPGDDGATGQATRYELRYSETSIDASNFGSATEVPLPAPGLAGQDEFALVSNLVAESTYYFAILAFDEAENTSGLSNALEVTLPEAPDFDGPTTVADLTASSPAEGTAVLTFTAPDDERDGGAASYELRYTAGPMTETSFPTGTEWTTVPTPSSAGQAEQITLDELAPAEYSFALRSRDEAGNISAVSNIATLDLRDTSPPDEVTDLAASSLGDGRIALEWSASGDNGRTGRALRHELRYATSAIDDSNFGNADLVPDSTPPGEPGTRESRELSGFRAETQYWFALVTYDEAENQSRLSNVAEVTTPDFEAPNAVTDIVAEEVTGTRARLFWTAPGDNGADGTAARYDMRFSLEPITEENFSSQSAVGNMPAPSAGGTNEEVTLVASQEVEVYLALRTEDEAGRTSPLSNVVFVRFGDDQPDAPTNVQAVAIGPDRIRLQWSHPGGEDYFEVERKSDTDDTFRRIGVVDRNGFAGVDGDTDGAAIASHYHIESGDHGNLGRDGTAGHYDIESSPRGRVGSDAIANHDHIESSPGTSRDVARRIIANAPVSISAGGAPASSNRTAAPETTTLRVGDSSNLAASASRRTASGDDIQVVNEGLIERTEYTYRLRAFSPGGPSAYSNEATATTPLAAPNNPSATLEGSAVRVRWSQGRDTDEFIVQRATGTGDFDRDVNVPGTERDWLDETVEPGTTYRYRVRSRAGLQDAATNEVSVTTGESAPECEIRTNGIEFGTVAVGSQRSDVVIITNVGGGRLQGAFVSECPDFLVETTPFDLGPNETTARELVFRPTSSGEKVCFLGVPGGCGDVVAFGVGEASAECRVTGDDNDFGTLPPGGFTTRSFVVENVGGGVLRVLPSILDDSAGVFSIVGANDYPVDLGPNGSHEVIVRFEATASGTHQATLHFGASSPATERESGGDTPTRGTSACGTVPLVGATEQSGVCDWGTDEIDFGTVEVGSSSSRRWFLRNVGSAPLDGIAIDCPGPFQIANLSSFHIEPGQTYVGYITFEPTAAGEATCDLRVDLISGAECTPLLIRGVGGVTACLTTPAGLDFGEVPAGTPVTQTLTVANSGTSDLVITPTIPTDCRTNEFVIVTGGGTQTLAPSQSADIQIRFESDDPGRDYACTVEFGADACSEVQIVAKTEPVPCSVAPTAYGFGNVIVGQSYSQRFYVYNNTDETKSGVIKATCAREIGLVRDEDRTYTIDPGDSHAFHFDLTPTLGAANYEIVLSDEDCDRIPISWTGELEDPDCFLSTSGLTFETAVGESKTKDFTISNTGNVSLYLNLQFREPDGCAAFEFLSGGGETRLDPGYELRVRIRYTPTEVGSTVCHLLPLVDGHIQCGFVTLVGTATN
ncbi:MAG: choice-of-anchor D domain-containing protein [Candidatus Eisenbacteria bacterium]